MLLASSVEMIVMGQKEKGSDCENRDWVCRAKVRNRGQTTVVSQENRGLSPILEKLFDNRSTYTSYVSFNRGSRFERDGRMIVWGLNDKDSRTFCGLMKNFMWKGYSGEVRCVFGRGI